MDAEDTGSGKEDEPEQEITSEQEDDDGAGPSTSSGSNAQSSSSNRHMRNMAEKMRRDKLNFFIGELSTLVPIISFSPKKLDKTSILRLAATYIRLHNVIFGSVRRDRRTPVQNNVHRQMLEYLPQYLASFNWSENVLEEMDGMLMIVNGAGRIIFISHTVEKLLGHTQIELMGQSLYNLTCLEDYDELKRNLAPDDNYTNANSSEGGADDSRSSCDSLSSGSTSTTPPARLPTLPFHLDSDGSDQRLRRSFYIRLRQRAQSRSDQPQYELVHVFGHLRVPPQSTQQTSSHQQQNLNDVILVAVVKPFKEKRITTLSLMEACREEFITRHTLDGRIIYTDHRISIVAGYLAEEVCGIPGFQYMHKEDMRWTMVGLRQMYFRGSSYGQSCYRLQTKNGNFIYLKTCGYLELSESNDSFQSLICINSLVTQVEGETLIRQMKDQYSPVIKNKDDRNMEILSSNIQLGGKTETVEETEDPKVLEQAISQMISNVPNHSTMSSNMHSPSPSNVDRSHAAKVALVAKALPPLSIQIKKIGIVPPIIRTPAAIAASLSPPSSHHSPPMKDASPPTPPRVAPPPPQQDRPSVLRVARQGGETIMSLPDHSSVLKLKRMRTDEQGQGVVMSMSPVTPTPTPTHSVVVSPLPSAGSKRKNEDSDWPEVVDVSLSPSTSSVSVPTTPAPHMDQTPAPSSPNFHLDQLFNDELSNLTTIMQDDNPSPTELVGNLEELQEIYTFPWGQPGVSEILLETSHSALDTQMQRQEDQINEIGQELEMVPVEHTNGQVYNSKLTQLQVEHRKQQQMLKTLQQDHQSIQQMGVCSSQQNIGF